MSCMHAVLLSFVSGPHTKPEAFTQFCAHVSRGGMCKSVCVIFFCPDSFHSFSFPSAGEKTSVRGKRTRQARITSCGCKTL